VIEVTGLRKSYGGRTILDGVDLAVRPGELVALLGPNGAGKTTTVEIVEGYRAADGGSVRVLGVDPRTGGPALRARVGLMLQDGAGLEPRATVRDLVRLHAAFHDRGPASEELIDRVGLANVAGSRVRRLSGGERQRLALALALAGDPEVLVLDEPTAGMDPEARRATRQLVGGLRDEGRTVLLTTHDLGDVERLADRVAVLHGGRIVADAPPEELLTAADSGIRFRTHGPPDEPALARLRARLAASRPAVGVRAIAPEGWGEGSAFEIEPGAASADVVLEVARWAAREGLLIVELHAGATSLEERYLELTGDRDVEAAP
jgi:ABC-2 type transport system ATP-binding protein